MNKGLPPSEETVIDSATGTVMSSAGRGDYTGTVSVQNGTEVTGLAGSASSKIATLGFSTTATNADASNYNSTLIIYNTDDQESGAEAIQTKLKCGKIKKNNGEYPAGTDYIVIVGSDYASITNL